MNSAKSVRLIEQIRKFILTDFAKVIGSQDSTIGKFILIAVGIEFLGAGLDKQHINATARSEKRFNLAITKLFPKKYHHFTKAGSIPYLYTDFRCPVIHQFKSEQSISLYAAADAKALNLKHLGYNESGSLVLVAEEFYADLAAAGNEYIARLAATD